MRASVSQLAWTKDAEHFQIICISGGMVLTLQVDDKATGKRFWGLKQQWPTAGEAVGH